MTLPSSAPWRTLRTPEVIRRVPREQARQAREYAERWYQAIREPVIDEVPLAPYDRGSPSSRTMQLVGVGGYSAGRGRASGGGGGGGTVCYVRTPGPRRFTEREIGAEITTMTRSASRDLADLGALLERVRGETSLGSLLRENGTWVHPRERAVRYAVAVLTLATRLGDARAEAALLVIRVGGGE